MHGKRRNIYYRVIISPSSNGADDNDDNEPDVGMWACIVVLFLLFIEKVEATSILFDSSAAGIDDMEYLWHRSFIYL